MYKLSILGWLLLAPTILLSDVPPGCEVVDHSGGYVCPPTEAQIEDYKASRKHYRVITAQDLVEKYGEPDWCEEAAEFQQIDCASADRSVEILGQLIMSGFAGQQNCNVQAYADEYVFIWRNQVCPDAWKE